MADLEREIEVSHWGNVYVTENYKLRNAGAKHKGTFSRSAVGSPALCIFSPQGLYLEALVAVSIVC